MKSRKHRRKESFSILLVSNTGQNSRHFRVTKSFLWLFAIFILLTCASTGWLIYNYLSGSEIVRNYVIAKESARQDAQQSAELAEYLGQIESQEVLIQQLQEENDTLARENTTLTSENKALLAAARTVMGTEDGEAENVDDSEEDPAYPSRYPYSEMSVVAEKYSDDHPYVSIDVQADGEIVAAGDGTILSIGSDDNYPLIIEIEHGNGYRTRYMFSQDANLLQEEGTQVQAGAALASVEIQNAQLDYQVIYEENPIDPMIVIEAKG